MLSRVQSTCLLYPITLITTSSLLAEEKARLDWPATRADRGQSGTFSSFLSPFAAGEMPGDGCFALYSQTQNTVSMSRRRYFSLLELSLGTFRSEDEDDCEYEFSILSMRIRFGGRHFSKCACSEQETRTCSRPRPPI